MLMWLVSSPHHARQWPSPDPPAGCCAPPPPPCASRWPSGLVQPENITAAAQLRASDYTPAHTPSSGTNTLSMLASVVTAVHKSMQAKYVDQQGSHLAADLVQLVAEAQDAGGEGVHIHRIQLLLAHVHEWTCHCSCKWTVGQAPERCQVSVRLSIPLLRLLAQGLPLGAALVKG